MKAAIRSIGIYRDGTLYANVQTTAAGPTQYAAGVPHAVFALIEAFVRNQTAQRRMGAWSWEWKSGFIGRPAPRDPLTVGLIGASLKA